MKKLSIIFLLFFTATSYAQGPGHKVVLKVQGGGGSSADTTLLKHKADSIGNTGYSTIHRVDSIAALKQNLITTYDSTITATASQTVMPFGSVPSDYSTYMVWRNYMPMAYTTDYTASGGVITFTFGLTVGDKIRYHRTK